MLELADGIFARLPAPPHIALTRFELSPLDFGEEGEPVQATDRTSIFRQVERALQLTRP